MYAIALGFRRLKFLRNRRLRCTGHQVSRFCIWIRRDIYDNDKSPERTGGEEQEIRKTGGEIIVVSLPKFAVGNDISAPAAQNGTGFAIEPERGRDNVVGASTGDEADEGASERDDPGESWGRTGVDGAGVHRRRRSDGGAFSVR